MCVSVKAIRRRIKRSTLAQVKRPHGTVDVLLSADQAQPATDQSTDQPLLVARVENEIQFLREKLGGVSGAEMGGAERAGFLPWGIICFLQFCRRLRSANATRVANSATGLPFREQESFRA
jgi:hypothetical protein